MKSVFDLEKRKKGKKEEGKELECGFLLRSKLQELGHEVSARIQIDEMREDLRKTKDELEKSELKNKKLEKKVEWTTEKVKKVQNENKRMQRKVTDIEKKWEERFSEVVERLEVVDPLDRCFSWRCRSTRN